MPWLTNSPDPEHQKLREQVAREMAEWERINGPVQTLPCIQREGDEFVARASNGQKCLTINREKMRKRQEWKEGRVK